MAATSKAGQAPSTSRAPYLRLASHQCDWRKAAAKGPRGSRWAAAAGKRKKARLRGRPEPSRLTSLPVRRGGEWTGAAALPIGRAPAAESYAVGASATNCNEPANRQGASGGRRAAVSGESAPRHAESSP